jgi:UDP-N-acetylmuramoyl-tripeptide--D-alanyl-D-alanine ligase
MMMQYSLQQLADICNAKLFNGVGAVGAVSIAGVSIDSRTIQPGDLFVALRGENFDAHDFLQDVQASGAVAALVESVQPAVNFPQLLVKDSVVALGVLAAKNRQSFNGKIIGLTGSAGKTTTKEMMAAILAQLGNPLVTAGNLNNHIGVPLTLLRLSAEHDCAVIEMGASALGDIAYLASMVKPDVALITNVSAAHVEGFGSIENIARGKAEIFASLSPDGVAVINMDNQWTAACSERLLQTCKLLTFSTQKKADVYAGNIEKTELGMSFLLRAQDEECLVQLPFMGEHNVGNAVAAASCCLAIGVSISAIVAGLKNAQPYKGRLQRKTGKNACTVIDDTYNANPASVQMAINTLMTCAGQKIMVLGDMGELGEQAQQMHADLGGYARAAGIKTLLATGQLSSSTVAGFGEGALHFPDWQALSSHCLDLANDTTVFLVKGSRSAAMERVVNVLTSAEEKKL